MGDIMSTAEVFKWVKNRLREQSLFPDLEVKNFTSSFADGKVFLAMLSIPAPAAAAAIRDGCDWGSESAILNCIDQTFAAFLDLGLPRLLDADDLRVKPYPDKLSVATYMIEMRRRWDRMVGETVPATLPPKQDRAIVSELAQKELEEAIRQHQHELDEVRRRLQSKQKELLETEQRSSEVLDSLNANQRQLDALVRRREELEKDIESQERKSMLLSPPTPSK